MKTPPTNGHNVTQVVLYDMTSLRKLDTTREEDIRRLWDEIHFATSIQGIVNRHRPRLFLRYIAERDDFWWNLISGPGGWLENCDVLRIENPAGLVDRFRNDLNGVVVWDEQVPATSNAASTLAGTDNLACLRYDPRPNSLHSRAITEWKLEVRERLLMEDGSPLFTGQGVIPGTSLLSTGSPKNDAILWSLTHSLKSGRCDPSLHGYYIDAFWLKCGWCGDAVSHTLPNHDYIIANKGFFWDLHMWDDEAPVDDPQQRPGLDVETLECILAESNRRLNGEKMIHVAGYVPWRYKYTDTCERGWNAGGEHGAVSTEWRCTQILSSWNAYLDADALDIATMVNSSFFQHYPLPAHIPQKRKPVHRTEPEDGKKYFAHYCGDYDAAAWLYWMLPEIWTDESRGSLPLNWAFNPSLAKRHPLAMHWIRQTATENDYFMTGDCGAGYVNPHNLSEPRPWSGLPSGVPLWEKHCSKWMHRFDLDVVGFIIDGHTEIMRPDAMDAYARFSPGGFVFHRHPSGKGAHNGVPFTRMAADLPKDAQEAARLIVEEFREDPEQQLKLFRSVIMTPAWYVEVHDEIRRLDPDVVQVDYPTLLGMIYNAVSKNKAGLEE